MKKVTQKVAPALAVAIILALLGAYITLARGQELQRPELNTAGIWASSNAEGLVGRFSKPASALEFGVYPDADLAPHTVDVLQDREVAVAVNRDEGRLYPIDSLLAKPLLDRYLELPSAAVFDLRGGTLAVVDGRSGKVWGLRTQDVKSGLDVQSLDAEQPQLADLGPGSAAALAVGVDGTIYAVSTSGASVTIKPSEDGIAFEAPQVRTLPFSGVKSVQVTAVGEQAIFFNGDTGTAYLPGDKTAELGVNAVLQQPGAESDRVVYAVQTELAQVGFDAVTTTLVSGTSGSPAAPVVVAGCAYGTWSGDPGLVARACVGVSSELRKVPSEGSDYGQELISPVLRSNFDAFILNDLVTGRIYDWDLDRNLDDWKLVMPEDEEEIQTENKDAPMAKDLKPVAVDDNYGVRPGRTVVLHVLDNDNDPNGSMLSVVGVTQPKGGAKVTIAPDGQSVLYTQPENGVDATFTYEIHNGVDKAAATVKMEARDADQRKENKGPELRMNYDLSKRTYPVGPGGTVTAPVSAEWRDYDGDPITVSQATDDTGANIAVTADGLIEYTSPGSVDDEGDAEQLAKRSRDLELAYQVTDGLDFGDGSVKVEVVADKTGKAAEPEPDIGRGLVGEPITINPLANDIPGVDPTSSEAKLRLSADVDGPPGVTVATDRTKGTVTVTAGKAGFYNLTYSVTYGMAPLGSAGKIRVEVSKKLTDDLPVAMPDEIVLRGTTPVTTDPLKNDYDPRGGMLSVMSATAADPDQVTVSVVDRRWLSVTANVPTLSGPQLVTYQITNGDGRLVNGTATVSQLPAIEPDEPVLRPDSATIREGDSELVEVLANDTTTGGSPLTLLSNVEGQEAGQLRVNDPSVSADNQGNVGSAYIVGEKVRVVAPPPGSLSEPRTVQVTYVARTNDGKTASQVINVEYVPALDAEGAVVNRPPEPQTVEVRVVAGESTEVKIDTSGQDPDGDLVTLIGIGSGPKLGRVTEIVPDGFTYDAYPDDGSTGTDTFTYKVVDQYGATGLGIVRINVVHPGQMQPPVAADDVMTAEPGQSVRIDVLDNDYISVDDNVSVELVDEEAPAKLNGTYIEVVTPDEGADPVQVQYALRGNADGETIGTVSLTGKVGFRNPPRVKDVVAESEDNKRASADCLKEVFDPDSDMSQLSVSVPNATEDQGLTIDGGVVSVNLAGHPQVITYVVTDPEGAWSSGLIYVPAKDSGPPYVVGTIQIPANSEMDVTLTDYVKSPRADRTVKIALAHTASVTPAANMDIEVFDSMAGFKLTSKNDYTGPGSVILDVTETDISDPDGNQATVSIPVQVGPVTPVLRCPTAAQTVRRGADKDFDIASMCHLWPAGMADVVFDVEWKTQPDLVDMAVSGGTLRLTAQGEAQPGDTGALVISMPDYPDSVPAEVGVQVLDANKPQIAAISLEVSAGTTVSQEIKVRSPLKYGRQDTIVSCEPKNTLARSYPCSISGDTWTITPGTNGKMTYKLTISDVADTTLADRHASTTITLKVYDVPGKPARPTATNPIQSHAVTMKWTAPDDNGAPIDYYEMRRDGGNVQRCSTTTCTAAPIANRDAAYRFEVRAHNRAGFGPWSDPGEGIADAPPANVSSCSTSDELDGSIRVNWIPLPASSDYSPPTNYVVAWPGESGQPASGSVTSFRISSGLSNVEQTFKVWAKNRMGLSAIPAECTGWPSGPPGAFSILSIAPATTNANSTAVTIDWSASAANGRTPVKYVLKKDGSAVGGCQNITATQCVLNVTLNGAEVHFQVVSHNSQNADPSDVYYTATPTETWYAEGRPPKPSVPNAAPTGVNQELHVSGSVPDSRGTNAYVKIFSNGSLKASVSVNARGGSYSADIQAGPNGSAAQITVQLCYTSRKDGSEQCGDPSAARSATPFGPLSLNAISISRSGTHLIATVTGNANGYAATLTLEAPSCSSATDTGAGALTATLNCDLGGWGLSKTFTASLTTSSTPARSIAPVSATGTTDIPQPLGLSSISVSLTATGQLTATVTGDGKGYGATMEISGPCGSNTWNLTGSESHQLTCSGLAPGNYSFNAKIWNTEPLADSLRPTVTASAASGNVPDPPVRSVRISKGDSYDGRWGNICSSVYCKFVRVQTHNFSGTYTCRLYDDGMQVDIWQWTGDQDDGHTYVFGFPGRVMSVNCDGETDSITW
ncbi:MAG: hypothetical protein LBR58_11630 [Propionibacteriaceae bacterium]|nr:hypothetical protein [Propionibacteriaceae bacterium]